MSKAIAFALLFHQLTSKYFIGVEDIFPNNDGFLTSNFSKNIIYYTLAMAALMVALIPNKLAAIFRRKKSMETE